MSVNRGWLGVALLVITGSTAHAQTPPALQNPLFPPPQPPAATQPFTAGQPPAVAADMLPIPPGQVLSSLPFENRPAPPTVQGPGGVPAVAAPLVPDGPQHGIVAADASILGAKRSTTQGWLDYEQPGCCGPVGGNGPINYDLYFRFGTSVPFGPGVFARTLNAGYLWQMGGRSLFFNPAGDRAFVIDVGVFYHYYNAGGQTQIGYIQNSRGTIRNYLQTGASLGFGYDWYSTAPGFVTGTTSCTHDWGFDFGIRYGSNHAGLNVNSTAIPYARLQDNFGAAFIAVHTDWVFPMGGWDFLVGGRVEATYSWTDVLRSADSELYNINFLLTTGVRF